MIQDKTNVFTLFLLFYHAFNLLFKQIIDNCQIPKKDKFLMTLKTLLIAHFKCFMKNRGIMESTCDSPC